MFTNQNEVLGYDDSLRINPPIWVIFSFAIYIVWQMVITFFSTNTLCLYGKTPIPISAEYTIFIIISGYISSAIFLYLYPTKTVSILRKLLIISLVSTILIYIHLPSFILSLFFYIQAFICVFMIGGYVGIIVPLFSAKSELTRIPIATLLLGVFGTVLHYDNFNLPYEVFNTLSVICQLFALIALFNIPKNLNICYIKNQLFKEKESSFTLKFTPPKILIFGFWFAGAITGLLYCFCATISESIFNGVSIMHFSAIFGAILFMFLLKKVKISPTKIFSIFISLFFLGFVLATISINIPVFRLFACILFGISMIICDFYTYFGILAFSKYPSRILTPIVAILALLDIILHYSLLEIFRIDLALLYSIYTIIATILVIVYFFIEPYFTHSLNETSHIKFLPPGKIKKPSVFAILSEQETILANFILEGYTESSISKMMNITLNTQKSYRKTLYNKLQIHSKRELFALSKRI